MSADSYSSTRDFVGMSTCADEAALRYQQSRPYQEGGNLVGYGTFSTDVLTQGTETIVEEAVRITQGDRNDDYGPPSVDLANIGRAWGATLSNHFDTPYAPIPPHVVALLMIQLKCVREAHEPKRDNRVDLIGYAICVEASLDSPQEDA